MLTLSQQRWSTLSRRARQERGGSDSGQRQQCLTCWRGSPETSVSTRRWPGEYHIHSTHLENMARQGGSQVWKQQGRHGVQDCRGREKEREQTRIQYEVNWQYIITVYVTLSMEWLYYRDDHGTMLSNRSLSHGHNVHAQRKCTMETTALGYFRYHTDNALFV